MAAAGSQVAASSVPLLTLSAHATTQDDESTNAPLNLLFPAPYRYQASAGERLCRRSQWSAAVRLKTNTGPRANSIPSCLWWNLARTLVRSVASFVWLCCWCKTKIVAQRAHNAAGADRRAVVSPSIQPSFSPFFFHFPLQLPPAWASEAYNFGLVFTCSCSSCQSWPANKPLCLMCNASHSRAPLCLLERYSTCV